MSYEINGKEYITRTELLLQNGLKDLSKIFNHYEIKRYLNHFKIKFTNLNDIQDGDRIRFSLPNFNQIFIVMSRDDDDHYAMTLYPPIRSTFDAWSEDSEVILDHKINTNWNLKEISIDFHIFKNYRKLPRHLINQSLGFGADNNKPKTYSKILKEQNEFI